MAPSSRPGSSRRAPACRSRPPTPSWGAWWEPGLYEVGAAQIGWAVLAQKAALPLLASPLVALALVFAAARPLAALTLGGLVAGRRVLTTSSERITALPLGESLAASGVSSILVALASWRGLPVSTAHVTTGGIVGAGIARSAREVRWPVVKDVALSWIVTLPAAAAVALLAGFALNR